MRRSLDKKHKKEEDPHSEPAADIVVH